MYVSTCMDRIAQPVCLLKVDLIPTEAIFDLTYGGKLPEADTVKSLFP